MQKNEKVGVGNIIKNMRKKYNIDLKAFLDKQVCSDAERGFISGWSACKEEVLKILTTQIANLDLSWEEVDERFIEKVKKL